MRELRRGEEAQVDDLLALAFKGQDEVRLVHRLRKDRAIAGEMVISADNRIVAYAGLSQMIRPKGWLCLAPVAVHPDWQGRHIGSRMVGMITEWARLTIRYKLSFTLHAPEEPVVKVSKKEFCRLIKGAELCEETD